jgi:LysR family transcriptional regulator, low CO2-responsive transcriptional regulator
MDDLNGLKVFTAVAELNSFTRAAEKTYLTQSAVSHQIGRLEKSLGVSLFDRLGRRVQLTRAGEALLVHTRRVLNLLDEAVLAVKQASRPDVGSLRVGASATACQFIIPETLREFRECYPGYALSIQPGDSPQVVEDLQEGKIDLGILIKPERASKLVFHPLFRDELGLVMSRVHPLAGRKRVAIEDLAKEKWVLYSRASATWQLVEQHFARHQVHLREPIELGSIEAIKELVKLGLGMTVLSQWVCQREVEEGSLQWRSLPGSKLARQWCVAAEAGKKLSIAQQTFVSLCQAASVRLGV